MMKHQPNQDSLRSSQAGFTIMESLLALMVAAILLVGISPIITMAVAARVQSRRVERATEAAKTYIDGVRSGAILAPTQTVGTAPDPITGTGAASLLDGAPAPVDLATLYCVDLDKTPGCQDSSSNDLVVQGFRSATVGGDPTLGYRLGVRVYRASAFGTPGALLKSAGGNRATQAAFSGTLGNSKAPVLEMTTDIAPTNEQNSLSTWCDRLRDSSNTSSQCR